MVRQLLVAASLFALSAAGVANAQDSTDSGRLALEGIAAVVNDKPISYSDVRQRARLLLLSLGGQQPSQEQIQQITGQALEQLIDESLQLEKASEFAWNRVMSGLYGSRIRVSENQVDDQLERMRSASKKTQYRVSEIFLFAPDEETKTQALAAANTVLDQLKQGADFRVAAQRISSAPTAATGGDMGWVSTEDLAPELAAAVSGIDKPGLLEPIPVENGVYILLVANKREPSQAVTKVNLKRLFVTDGKEEDLQAAMDQIKTCDDVQSVANSKTNLRAADLDEINVDELGPEGKDLVMQVDVGQPTAIFAASGGLATMYVCARNDGAEALPSRDDLKGSLKNRELGMISERELRNLRREATIIYR